MTSEETAVTGAVPKAGDDADAHSPARLPPGFADALVAQSPFGIALYDARGRVVAANPAYERHWGIRLADVPPDYSLLGDPQLEHAGLLPLVRRAYAGEHVMLPPVRYDAGAATHGAGRTVWTQGHCFPVRDAAGTVTHLAITFLDVTGHVEAEHAALATRRRMAVIVERLPAPTLVVTGAQLVIAAANEAYRRLAEGRALVGRPLAEALPELAAQGFVARIERVRDSGVAERGEAVVREGEGTSVERVLDFVYEPLPASDGEPPGVVIQLIDRTEHHRLYEAERRARAEVEELNARLGRAVADLQAVLDVVPVGIGIAQDPDCRDIRVNPAFASQLGVDAGINASKSGETGDGLGFRVQRDGRDVPPEELIMQRAARERRTLGGLEYDVVHADGRTVRLLEYAAPLLDAAGAVRGAVGAFVDITERERLVQAERAARAEAERANRAKGEFLAVMSHELRTPLNAIGGYAELMAMGIRGPVSVQQQEDLERIQRSQRHLLGLINEVLNYARLETGSVRYEIADVGVAGTIAAVESLVLPQAREKALTLDVESCDPHLCVRADREKLQQVLVNLLSNAIKFTGRGGRITVTCHRVADAAHGDRVALTVHDTGVGIPPDKLEAVFEPFVQVGRALNSPSEGTGLGLAISRDLARGMGGDLTAESEAGVGSAFTLTLPVGGT